jgi:glucokinase
MAVAGVDVGGTNIGVGLVQSDHSVHHRSKEPTPTSIDELVGQVGRLVGDYGDDADAVGLALPAIIDKGAVVQMPNIEGWTPDLDVAAMLAEQLGVPVDLVNDAQAGVLGEWVAGAAEGDGFVLGLWLGTGVGGGLVLDGRSYVGSGGGSGEIGHMVVHPGGARCGCGRRGCLEAYAGRRMMTASAAALQDTGRPTSLFQIQEKKGKPKATSGVWQAALEDGDEVAIELIAEAIGALGLAVASCLNLLDLDRVVIGGGMADRLDDLAARIAEAARPHAVRKIDDGLIVIAELGDDSGLVGAAHVAREALAG